MRSQAPLLTCKRGRMVTHSGPLAAPAVASFASLVAPVFVARVLAHFLRLRALLLALRLVRGTLLLALLVLLLALLLLLGTRGFGSLALLLALRLVRGTLLLALLVLLLALRALGLTIVRPLVRLCVARFAFLRPRRVLAYLRTRLRLCLRRLR